MGNERLDPVEAARAFALDQIAELTALFLSGSVGRESIAEHSDLDLVVIAPGIASSWSTHEAHGWPIELFAESSESIVVKFEKKRRTRWPLILTMCAEATILNDESGTAKHIQHVAREALAAGPLAMTDDEIGWYRYNLSWMIEDLADADDLAEFPFLAADVVTTAIETHLLRHQTWLGKGKWLFRLLRQENPGIAAELVAAQRSLSVEGDREPLLIFARRELDAIGGYRFGGQSGNW